MFRLESVFFFFLRRPYRTAFVAFDGFTLDAARPRRPASGVGRR